jgi:hypothetical protein
MDAPWAKVAISGKKNFPRNTEQRVCSDGIPAMSRNKKLSEFNSKPFLVREKHSEFCFLEQNYEQTFAILLRTILQKSRTLGILFRGIEIEQFFGNLFSTIPWKRKNTQNSVSFIIFK